MAHLNYHDFAKLAREMGDEDTARTFEATADQEVMHAFGHLDLLFPKATMTPDKALQFAIEGETYEYTEMYLVFAKRPKKMAMLQLKPYFTIYSTSTHNGSKHEQYRFQNLPLHRLWLCLR